jgi:hypothetical protein
VKDLPTRREIIRCDSSRPLYPLRLPATALHASTSSLWHQRLGHPDHAVLSHLAKLSVIPCNKSVPTTLCHVCQLGHHVWLPFHASTSRATKPFQIIHCDIWTSLVTSVSDHKYYLVILDDYSRYGLSPCGLSLTPFPRSPIFPYVHTQFNVTIQ